MPTGTVVTDDQVATIQRLRAAGLPWRAISAEVGVSPDTARRLRRDDRSGRRRVLAAVVANPTISGVPELRRHVPDIDEHNLTHLLYSLRRAGMVRFRVDSSGPSRRPVAIVPTPRGRNGDAVGQASLTVSAPVDVAATVAPEDAAFPLVDALAARSSRYAAAAALLEAAGADDLALAAMAKVDDATPLEREVIRLYAAWRRCTGADQ